MRVICSGWQDTKYTGKVAKYGKIGKAPLLSQLMIVWVTKCFFYYRAIRMLGTAEQVYLFEFLWKGWMLLIIKSGQCDFSGSRGCLDQVFTRKMFAREMFWKEEKPNRMKMFSDDGNCGENTGRLYKYSQHIKVFYRIRRTSVRIKEGKNS